MKPLTNEEIDQIADDLEDLISTGPADDASRVRLVADQAKAANVMRKLLERSKMFALSAHPLWREIDEALNPKGGA